MKKINKPQTARILFNLAALFSIGAGASFFLGYPQVELAIRQGISAGLLLHGLILFAFGWLIGQNPPRYPLLAAGFVFLSLVAFIFDDMGPIDFAAMGFYLILFVLCIRIHFSSGSVDRLGKIEIKRE